MSGARHGTAYHMLLQLRCPESKVDDNTSDQDGMAQAPNLLHMWAVTIKLPVQSAKPRI
jgi:hypothetical protein